MNNYNTITECRVCGSKNIEQYLDLGLTPWCNGILSKEQFEDEKFYPLRLAFCHNCTTSNLLDTIPKKEMFSNHTYVSGTTKTLADHFLNIAKDVIEKFNVYNTDLIVDIGGNDGTNLLQYKNMGGKNLVNVESAKNIAQLSIRNKITTLNKFFDKDITRTIYTPFFDRYAKQNDNEELEIEVAKLVNAKVINASGVFFHLEDLHSVCEGVKNLLREDGVFVVQFMYIDDIIKKLQFDSIYHEHLLFYTKKSLCILLEKYGLYPHEFYHSDIHGGSMIAYFTKKKIKESKEVYIEDESLYNIKTYKKFSDDILVYREKLVNIIYNIFTENTFINLYGVPAKSTTLLNYCNIGQYIDFAEEANQLKCGYYTPGTHIPIVHYSAITDRPKYYLITSWNFLKEFIKKEIKYLEDGGSFIVPFPNDPFIIDKNNYNLFIEDMR